MAIPDFQSFLLPALQLASKQDVRVLMFDCDIGIQAKQDSKAYVLKEIDGDFFDDLGER